MSTNYSSNLVEGLEREYLSNIRNQSLSELSDLCGLPLDNFTDLLDLANMIYDKAIQYLLQKEEFLNIPIIAHFSRESKETFLIEEYALNENNVIPYRAIEIDTESGYCCLSFCVRHLDGEVKNSKYKVVRDILPLIDFNSFMDEIIDAKDILGMRNVQKSER